MRLLQACNSPDTEFTELADIISQDAGLTSKMLNVANSPLYAQWGEFSDLNRMLVVLGLSTIRTIAITTSVVELFTGLPAASSRFAGRFWYHSLLCALIAKNLAAHIGYRNVDEVYLTGLLHRIGQLVMFNGDPRTYSDLYEQHADPADLMREEQRVYGISHDALGAWLVKQWRLGEPISDAVLYQHSPGSHMLDAPDLIKLMGVASRLCDPQQKETAYADAALLLDLQEQEIDVLVEQAEDALQQAADSFGVTLDAPLPPPATEAAGFPPQTSELARLVQESTLLESVKSAMWQEAKSRNPYAAIHVFLNILFGFQDVLFFVVDENGQLQGKSLDQKSRWLEQLRIPVKFDRSLMCDTLLTKKAIDSFQYEAMKGALNVIDRQMIRMIGKAGLLAIPMIAEGQSLGVLAVGVERSTLDSMQTQRQLLDMFVGEAAKLLQSQQEEEKARQLLVAESRAQMVQRARRIRHEANNPLGIIKNYLYILEDECKQEERSRPELKTIRDEINRVENLLHGLTEHMQESEAPPDHIDVNKLISELLTVLQAPLFERRNIELSLDLDQSIPALEADKDKIKQILVNLLKNASEAMHEPGQVSIHTQDNVLGESQPYVEIGIKDSGPGIPAAVREHLFRPVVSTKGGKHSGLGLSITARLVKEMSGSIRCRTGPRGTEFLILIPRHSKIQTNADAQTQGRKSQHSA